jgi:hypothetical protein
MENKPAFPPRFIFACIRDVGGGKAETEVISCMAPGETSMVVTRLLRMAIQDESDKDRRLRLQRALDILETDAPEQWVTVKGHYDGE